MEEKSNIEILKEFARSTNRSISVKEIPYPITGIRTFQKYKRMICIPNNPENTSHFIWFGDPYAKIGYPTVFCGAFIPISSSIKSSIKIQNKNTLDKLNVFSKTKRNEFAGTYFNSKVTITGDMDPAARKLLSRHRIQDEILKALKVAKFMNISINQYNVDFVQELQNQSYFAIINPQSWDMDKNYIESTFRQIERIKSIIDME